MAMNEILAGTMTGPSPFGKLYTHPLMSNGTLFLMDPTHPLGAMSATPAHSDPIPNVALETARGLIPGATDAELMGIALNDETGADVASSIKTLTAKGGMYGLYSKEEPADGTGATRFGFTSPYSIRAYMLANPNHEFYASAWGKTLRSGRDYSGDGSASAPQAILSCAPSTSNYLFFIDGFTSQKPTWSGLRNCPGGTGDSLTNGTLNPVWDTPEGQPFHMSIAATSWNGALPESAATTPGPAWLTGDALAWGGHNQPGPSWIIEMAYLEDLTVSGRSYAEVDALDHALFAAAHAAGGAWYGDTFTDPATLP